MRRERENRITRIEVFRRAGRRNSATFSEPGHEGYLMASRFLLPVASRLNKKSGSFALPLCGVLLRRLLRLGKDDGPVERTGGEARNKVQQGGPDEGPRGARESARTSRDGVHFHNGMDIGVLRRSAESCNVSEEAVSVGRCEDTGPEGFMCEEIDLHFIGHRKATKMGSPSRPAPIHKQSGELDVGDFNSLDGAFDWGLFLGRRSACEGRSQA